LYFPEPGRNRIGTHPASEIQLPEGSAPPLAGHVIVDGSRLFLELAPGVQATLGDTPINGRVELRMADAATGRATDRVHLGRLILQPHRSGTRPAIRLRDPESPIRTGFRGLRWYPIAPRWRVQGRFIPYATPRTLPIQNILGDVEPTASPGEVEVRLGGRTVRLVALAATDQLWFVFRDANAGTETYGTKYLYTPLPDARGNVTLDFNRSYNPPCAYNPHTTCPLPPAENRLPLAIPAGEMLYEVPPTKS
jgi:uncharacterized protein